MKATPDPVDNFIWQPPPPGRQEFAQLARDLETQIAAKKIPIILGTTVTSDLIKEENPDTVILATGKKITIIGGGAVGVETALFLSEKGTLSAEAVKFLLVNRAQDPETLFEMATQGTKQITLIEMLDKMDKDIGKSTKWGMMQDLGRYKVKTNRQQNNKNHFQRPEY